MKNSNMKKKVMHAVLAGATLLVLVGLIAAAGKAMEKKQEYETELQERVETVAERQTLTEDASREVTWNGETYQYNRSIMNVLFLGVDKTGEVELMDTPGLGGQADCIMLLSMNKETGVCRMLQISRDTMTEVDLYDTAGNFYTSVQAQVATQYAYGNGEKSSCWAMSRTVSELLFDIPIDAYISMSIDAIGAINDAVGGVQLTLSEDYPSIGEEFKKGSTITLTGEQAEKFVRYRDTEVTGSNDDRMKRQVQYITALLNTVRSAIGAEESYFDRYSSYLKPYMVTDMDAKQLDAFADYQFDPEETWYLPGEMKGGGEHDEFYVNEEELREKLIQEYYTSEAS